MKHSVRLRQQALQETKLHFDVNTAQTFETRNNQQAGSVCKNHNTSRSLVYKRAEAVRMVMVIIALIIV